MIENLVDRVLRGESAEKLLSEVDKGGMDAVLYDFGFAPYDEHGNWRGPRNITVRVSGEQWSVGGGGFELQHGTGYQDLFNALERLGLPS